MSRVKKHRRAADSYRQLGMLDKSQQHEQRADQLEFGSFTGAVGSLFADKRKCARCCSKWQDVKYELETEKKKHARELKILEKEYWDNSDKKKNEYARELQERNNRLLQKLEYCNAKSTPSAECTECKEKLEQKIKEEGEYKRFWHQHRQKQDFEIRRLRKEAKEKEDQSADARRKSLGDNIDLTGNVAEIKKLSGGSKSVASESPEIHRKSDNAHRESLRDSIDSRRGTVELNLPNELESAAQVPIKPPASTESDHASRSPSKREEKKLSPLSPPPPPPPPPPPLPKPKTTRQDNPPSRSYSAPTLDLKQIQAGTQLRRIKGTPQVQVDKPDAVANVITRALDARRVFTEPAEEDDEFTDPVRSKSTPFGKMRNKRKMNR